MKSEGERMTNDKERDVKIEEIDLNIKYVTPEHFVFDMTIMSDKERNYTVHNSKRTYCKECKCYHYLFNGPLPKQFAEQKKAAAEKLVVPTVEAARALSRLGVQTADRLTEVEVRSVIKIKDKLDNLIYRICYAISHPQGRSYEHWDIVGEGTEIQVEWEYHGSYGAYDNGTEEFPIDYLWTDWETKVAVKKKADEALLEQRKKKISIADENREMKKYLELKKKYEPLVIGDVYLDGEIIHKQKKE